MLQNSHSQFIFAHFRAGSILKTVQDRGNVRIALKSCAFCMQVVGDDHVAVFVFQFAAGIFQEILCLHRKAAQDLVVSFVFSDIGKGYRGS